MGPWVTSDAAWTLAGVFAYLSIGLTSFQIFKHLKHYNCPTQQKWIVRILFMAPIYAFASWMSLKFFHLSIYFDTVRNIYEAFVIYNFLSLCFEYLGGEAAIMFAIKGRCHHPSWWNWTCCFSEFPYTPTFLRYCKQGTLQFCVVKLVMATVIIIMEATHTYNDGDLSANGGYLYVAIIYNISISIALMSLVFFYSATKDLLSPHQPVLKFLIVKSIIFVSFWQSVVIAIIEKADVITSSKDGSIQAGELAVAYQNFLICFEMFFASVLYLYAFPWRPYVVEGRGRLATVSTISRNFRSTLNPTDMIDDTIRNFSQSYAHYVRPATEDDDSEDNAQLTLGFVNAHTRRAVVKPEKTSLLEDREEPLP
eukprot:m.104717 g.104717  ORF g.104717 m.104717 type:complete len:367 (-) comp14184_c0_seq1:23-1123(-)